MPLLLKPDEVCAAAADDEVDDEEVPLPLPPLLLLLPDAEVDSLVGEENDELSFLMKFPESALPLSVVVLASAEDEDEAAWYDESEPLSSAEVSSSHSQSSSLLLLEEEAVEPESFELKWATAASHSSPLLASAGDMDDQS